MLNLSRHELTAYGSLWLLALLLSLADGAVTANRGSSSSLSGTVAGHQPTPWTVSTCPSRTVNYITHTLPQQCFKTSWQAAEVSSTPTANEDGRDAAPTPAGHAAAPSGDSSLTVTSTVASQDSGMSACGSVAASPAADNGPSHTTNGGAIEEPAAQASLHPTESSIPGGNPATSTETAVSSSSSISPDDRTSSSSATPHDGGDVDTDDSPLDNANFLSFEDWKKRNLAQAGQSEENVGKGRHAAEYGNTARRRPSNINNALDSLGEDAEIELDYFGGFGESGPQRTETPTWQGKAIDSESNNRNGRRTAAAQKADHSGVRSRAREAGTTSKERFNYASFDCAATILKTNPKTKGSSSILVENKDSYMLNECSVSNKFFIVELCDEILIDTIVLANFEFFSSMFRTFRVSVSDRYPVKLDRWKTLGTFEARNTRELQAFLIENPLIWTRYLRIEVLSHFGHEFYCPISLLRVHGTTMMEEFRYQQEEAAREDDDEYLDEYLAQGAVDAGETIVPEAVALEKATGRKEAKASESQKPSAEEQKLSEAAEHTVPPARESGNGERGSTRDGYAQDSTQTTQQLDQLVDFITPFDRRSFSELQAVLLPWSPSGLVCQPFQSPKASESKRRAQSSTRRESTTGSERAFDDHSVVPPPSSTTPSSSSSSSLSRDKGRETASPPTGPSAQGHPKSDAGSPSSQVHLPDQQKQQQQQQQQQQPHRSQTPPNQGSQGAPQTQTQQAPPPSMPTTQESFFKTVHKRLQLLETNATLSLQYIEDQSRILRDAFSKVEKRQLTKTTSFLENLNTTVLAELRGFRQQYEQIWHSTVIELESQREQSQREIVAVSARLRILADEVVFQKRMSIVQSILVLVCLGLVLFSRGAASASSNYLELPLIQGMLARSQGLKGSAFETEAETETPPASPGSPLSPLSPDSSGSSRHYRNQYYGYQKPQQQQQQLSPQPQPHKHQSKKSYSSLGGIGGSFFFGGGGRGGRGATTATGSSTESGTVTGTGTGAAVASHTPGNEHVRQRRHLQHSPLSSPHRYQTSDANGDGLLSPTSPNSLHSPNSLTSPTSPTPSDGDNDDGSVDADGTDYDYDRSHHAYHHHHTRHHDRHRLHHASPSPSRSPSPSHPDLSSSPQSPPASPHPPSARRRRPRRIIHSSAHGTSSSTRPDTFTGSGSGGSSRAAVQAATSPQSPILKFSPPTPISASSSSGSPSVGDTEQVALRHPGPGPDLEPEPETYEPSESFINEPAEEVEPDVDPSGLHLHLHEHEHAAAAAADDDDDNHLSASTPSLSQTLHVHSSQSCPSTPTGSRDNPSSPSMT
ncbi:hypothetical protein L228DRAFT_282644 [Xylona heveae TC161]|uniref:SUN domain-containing protein n=1 Tax=Xylona heveae (strain CBS 132557 / TC161) TaxID=1328760 RepID=A0A165GSE8_XYLHT|nr:hypothetical protein L228DRAFT_282644 [Xylona heveae TC161]KZF22535.1 hypothetical protein L228DRAFT_282644 [Xylona heveae TC161]